MRQSFRAILIYRDCPWHVNLGTKKGLEKYLVEAESAWVAMTWGRQVPGRGRICLSGHDVGQASTWGGWICLSGHDVGQESTWSRLNLPEWPWRGTSKYLDEAEYAWVAMTWAGKYLVEAESAGVAMTWGGKYLVDTESAWVAMTWVVKYLVEA